MSDTEDSGLSTQSSVLIPTWCEWGRGDSALLLIAPHGGRRPPVDAAAPPPGLRVNDLYTPDLTRTLAGTLDAGFIINRGMDRNTLDLNRISQVRRYAPWFLLLFVQEIERVIVRHGSVELLFIHGWNTGQPKCDTGIGAVVVAGELHVPDGAHLTVSHAYRYGRIAAFTAACAAVGIRTSVGERYPGSHRNNVLQLFTPRAQAIDDPHARRIATWVAEGRINALQLELGIPLRWPGACRDRFVEVMGEAFGHARPSMYTRQKAAVNSTYQGLSTQDSALSTQASGLRTAPVALQFYDPAAGIGMFAGCARMGPAALGARLLFFLGGERVALFTGEEHGEQVAGGVLPLCWESDEASMRLAFCGPMLLLEDARTYVDLEAALAASELVDAEVELRFEPRHARVTGAQFGAVVGHVCVAGSQHSVSTGAFANAAGFRGGGEQQTMLAATFGDERAVLLRGAGGSSAMGLHFLNGAVQTIDGARISVTSDDDVYTPDAFEWTYADGPPMRARALSHMPILRPAGGGRYLRVTFGVARFQWNGADGYGLYEYARPVNQVSRIS